MQNVNFAELTGIERILNVLLRKKKKKKKRKNRVEKSLEKNQKTHHLLPFYIFFFLFSTKEKITDKGYGLHEYLPPNIIFNLYILCLFTIFKKHNADRFQ